MKNERTKDDGENAGSGEGSGEAENAGLGEAVVPEDPDDPAVVGEIPDRRVVAIGTALLGICAAFAAYGFLGDDDPERRSVPTASVTYRVTGTGTAAVSYLARSEAGGATVEKGVDLPWHRTVRVPLGKDPAVSIQLGKRGGEASCTLSIRGEHQRRATASGSYGRATCTAELPAERPNERPAERG
ncbi:hypothetical protein ABZ953_03890 [Streptomyces sp. NPDC046465]|uniref:hypothetical protein n=1 Tax=Streptomyces sp. NPDC046465 TaxID=3155810 RepID=UPI0033F0DC5F